MQDNFGQAFATVCGAFCIYPLIVGALPMYLYMRFKSRVKIQSPVRIERKANPVRPAVLNRRHDEQ